MTRVAFLWHMHQPYYEDLLTREHVMPWVRLHGLKDYYGMVALLEEFPGVRVTVNLVPSLLTQLEAFAEGRARDRYLELGLKPADDLTPDETRFVLANFFYAQRRRMIEPHPRYAELLALRGSGVSTAEIEGAARRFAADELRDLQVWQKLAWIDPEYLEGDARVRALVAKGRGYTEEDKIALRAIELEILNRILPVHRERAEAGQIEISTSPFYHPILPLLCDTDIYLRTHPGSRMPGRRFVHPEDAFEQLERAAACHERLLGRRPVGLWPSEGSVSDAVVPLAVRAGFTWMATDELILARTLNATFVRDADGQINLPQRLYTPYRIAAGGAEIACGFRDHGLSDRIGFQYASWDAEAAADDFVARLVEAGRRTRAAGGEDPTIFVILDGENAWEHFEGGGRPFLRALYRRLAGHTELTTVTMSEACRPARQTLAGVFPGSWIDANFYIWIGHADDHRAWDQLAEARDLVETATDVDPAARARAREEVLIAEGSDWFWWYGDDHSSDHDAAFDDLYRRHLRNVYRLLGRPAPDDLFLTNITAVASQPTQIDPVARLKLTMDGEATSYFEWLGAGELESRDVAGTMHRTDREAPIVTRIWFGFDAQALCVRLDASADAAALIERGYSFTVTFLQPEAIRIVVRAAGGGTSASLWMRRSGQDAWTEGAFTGQAAAASILECAIPLADLHDGPLQRVAFVVTACDPSGTEIERHPADRSIDLAVPDPQYEARHWTA